LISKTRMLSLVQEFRWRDVEGAIDENPGLTGIRDKKGRNWLHLSCGVNIKKRRLQATDSIKTAEILLKAGLDINQEAFSEGEWKATPLWYSIAFGQNLALSEYLLKRGSDPNHCWWAAANNDDADAIRLLSHYGAGDPSSEDISPFLAAIQWNRFAAAEEFLKLGADVDIQDSKKMTALHYLLKKESDKKYVRMLIKYGARGDLRNEDGVTAAEIMMRKRDPEFREMAAQLLAGS
jgi:ankyrin repeat protein